MLMVNGLGQNHLKWLQVRKFSISSFVYYVDLWITFIHSWGGLEFQLKVCVKERKEKIWWYARKKWGFLLWLHFHQHSRKKNQNITYIFLNHSVNERNKFSWLWKTICFNGRNCMKKSKFVFGQIRIQGYWMIRCR